MLKLETKVYWVREDRKYSKRKKGDFLDDISPDEEVVLSRAHEYDSLMDYAAQILQDTDFKPVYKFEDDNSFGLLYEGDNSVVVFLDNYDELGISHFRVKSSIEDKAEAVCEAANSELNSDKWRDIDFQINGIYGADEASLRLKAIIESEK